MYENYKNKLFFIGNYCNSYFNHEYYKNILHEIKTGLNIYICKYYKNKIELNNLTQNISLSDTDYNNHFMLYKCNNTDYILKCLPSSIKQIDIKFRESKKFCQIICQTK